MKRMTPIELKAASLIQKDIELISRPFEKTAQDCEITQDQFIKIVRNFRREGLIRKFGAILRHRRAGYEKNALIVWSVPRTQTEKTGKIFSSFPFISHCYERKPSFKNRYNLFTMVHSKNEDISSLANIISSAVGISDFLILESIQEYKKSSPEYF